MCVCAFTVTSWASHTCPAAVLRTRWWTSSTSCTPPLMTSSITTTCTRWRPSATPVSPGSGCFCCRRWVRARCRLSDCSCRHGGVRRSSTERDRPRLRGRQHGAGPGGCVSHLQNPTSAQHTAADPGWHPLWYTPTHPHTHPHPPVL